jgi:hypothetical protein
MPFSERMGLFVGLIAGTATTLNFLLNLFLNREKLRKPHGRGRK